MIYHDKVSLSCLQYDPSVRRLNSHEQDLQTEEDSVSSVENTESQNMRKRIKISKVLIREAEILTMPNSGGSALFTPGQQRRMNALTT